MAELGKLQESTALQDCSFPGMAHPAGSVCPSLPWVWNLGRARKAQQRPRVLVGAVAVLAELCSLGVTWPLYPQPPELEQLGRMVELDSDMADITQEPAQEPLAEELAEEQEAVPASTHIVSTQGINPYVLQVSVFGR